MDNLIKIGGTPSEEAMVQAADTYRKTKESYKGDVVVGINDKLTQKKDVERAISSKILTKGKEVTKEVHTKEIQNQENGLDR